MLAPVLPPSFVPVQTALFAARNFEDLEQFLCLEDPQALETAISSVGLLKGHAYKFKKAIEAARRGEPPVQKQAKTDAKPAIRAFCPPTPGMKLGVLPVTKAVPLVKDVERLLVKLGEIDRLRDDVTRWSSYRSR